MVEGGLFAVAIVAIAIVMVIYWLTNWNRECWKKRYRSARKFCLIFNFAIIAGWYKGARLNNTLIKTSPFDYCDVML